MSFHWTRNVEKNGKDWLGHDYGDGEHLANTARDKLAGLKKTLVQMVKKKRDLSKPYNQEHWRGTDELRWNPTS